LLSRFPVHTHIICTMYCFKLLIALLKLGTASSAEYKKIPKAYREDDRIRRASNAFKHLQSANFSRRRLAIRSLLTYVRALMRKLRANQSSLLRPYIGTEYCGKYFGQLAFCGLRLTSDLLERRCHLFNRSILDITYNILKPTISQKFIGVRTQESTVTR
jgi:hypothetical protein